MVNTENDQQATSFSQLGLSKWLTANLQHLGFETPTSIQSKTIPAALQGQSVVGCAHTGSGKTACFALPILERLARDPYGIFALVLTPTRELAYQISEQFRAFSASNLNLRCVTITGGIDFMRQEAELGDIPHIVVATPGRFAQLLEIDQCNLNEYLDNLQFLVLDEADRMLTDITMESDMTSILDALSRKQDQPRQTLLFSATMAKNYTKLYSHEKIFGKFAGDAKFCLKEFGYDTEEHIEDDLTFKRTVANLEQKFTLVPSNVKEAHLIHVLGTKKLKKNQ